MSNDHKKKSAQNKNSDKAFQSKNIKHDPQAESARAVSGLRDTTDNNKK